MYPKITQTVVETLPIKGLHSLIKNHSDLDLYLALSISIWKSICTKMIREISLVENMILQTHILVRKKPLKCVLRGMNLCNGVWSGTMKNICAIKAIAKKTERRNKWLLQCHIPRVWVITKTFAAFHENNAQRTLTARNWTTDDISAEPITPITSWGRWRRERVQNKGWLKAKVTNKLFIHHPRLD